LIVFIVIIDNFYPLIVKFTLYKIPLIINVRAAECLYGFVR